MCIYIQSFIDICNYKMILYNFENCTLMQTQKTQLQNEYIKTVLNQFNYGSICHMYILSSTVL